ncbi:putative carboxymethylenebutenolidase protein [Coleophoma crateriformis]|uniref:Putative carboxymethylenebutenolidase protein n=1 Tax=Coleophoma crateriformis TaxID=565419 RepID=A0A3D8QYS8_9HELO|nr:putative carboxymethylenebutenolidase protein [Coleophoma crateriformis]
MADSVESTPVALPSAKPIRLAANVTLQPPLSRRGSGPALIIFLPAAYVPSKENNSKTLDPEPIQKWAEEGFCVIEVKTGGGTAPPPTLDSADGGVWKADEVIQKSVLALGACEEFDKTAIGAIVYENGLDAAEREVVLSGLSEVKALVTFMDLGDVPSIPVMYHAVTPATGTTPVTHLYESTKSANFLLPGHEHYEAASAGVAHTRSVGFLRQHLGGPIFDLEAIWDEHTLFEFGERNVEKTMGTMVDEPYVNHVPTLTGGVGRKHLTAFYRDHFIFNNPADTKLTLVSRTVGVDRVIDEFIFEFTHDKMVDWLIPGIPPTHKYVRVPFMSVVNIRGDRLYHEHIAWDQATVLRQLGLMPEYLPFPYPLADGRMPAKGKRFEYRVPTAGAETAMKLMDESSVASNQLLDFEIREVDDV